MAFVFKWFLDRFAELQESHEETTWQQAIDTCVERIGAIDNIESDSGKQLL